MPDFVMSTSLLIYFFQTRPYQIACQTLLPSTNSNAFNCNKHYQQTHLKYHFSYRHKHIGQSQGQFYLNFLAVIYYVNNKLENMSLAGFSNIVLSQKPTIAWSTLKMIHYGVGCNLICKHYPSLERYTRIKTLQLIKNKTNYG